MALDLQVIDDTFGKNADLYEDVLKVPTTATQEEIQLAYFDRRSELFTLLAKIDAAMKGPQSESSSSMVDQRRYKAEKQMDSVVFAAAGGYALQQTQSAVTTESSSVAISHTSSSAMSSTMSSNSNNDNNTSNNNSNNKRRSRKQQQQQQNQRDRTPPQQNQHASPPRTVTPTELPANISSSTSVSDTKSWIQSAFSGSLFSNDGDDGIGKEQEEFGDNVDTYNNTPTRKQKRRQQQQQHQPSSTSSSPDRPSAEYDHREQQQQEYPMEKVKEKKSLWGRKKRKKKKESKDSNGISLNNNIDSNRSSTSHTEHTTGTEMTRTGDQQGDGEDDDDTRTFLDDDGETFASASVFSNADEEELHKNAAATCGREQGMFGCITGTKTFRNISDEVSGACEDTLISVDQVFNAFTLTDKDIKAVTKKIHKAKMQLES
ncbi:hypothetical protein FRACYDRAFT_240600 [Fragilariopsis cylindrus CCMP1102]|uniref:Uncharacterized protein n=1 Tax=Fragilariopsis cylindrus CCMP1102 TaxID=635003 RepID=A0A1E7FCW9_9STRA|nr:hypothetical protein FRACYDRAFT_240600 [Fragilariopsis cylindrus CCMP1102]|eukprot:OEU15905.1 hypothetical protein FRACYDRAFT_240600 [Fragilariopsis cylindrus CCMP1102]